MGQIDLTDICGVFGHIPEPMLKEAQSAERVGGVKGCGQRLVLMVVNPKPDNYI